MERERKKWKNVSWGKVEQKVENMGKWQMGKRSTMKEERQGKEKFNRKREKAK